MINNDSKKKIVGFQLDDQLYEALLDLAAENGTSVSSVIRMITLDYLKRYKGFKITSKKSKGEQK